MTRHFPDLGSASGWLTQISLRSTTNKKHYPDLGSDASSVCNFCARFSDVFFAGKPVVASPNVGCFLKLYLDERQDSRGIYQTIY